MELNRVSYLVKLESALTFLSLLRQHSSFPLFATIWEKLYLTKCAFVTYAACFIKKSISFPFSHRNDSATISEKADLGILMLVIINNENKLSVYFRSHYQCLYVRARMKNIPFTGRNKSLMIRSGDETDDLKLALFKLFFI